MRERIFALAYANALIEKLWLKGIITDAEKKRLIEKNTTRIFA